MRRTAVFASLALAVTTTACQEAIVEPGTTAYEPTMSSMVEGEYFVDRGSATLGGRLSDTGLIDICGLSLRSEDYVCPSSTPVIDWLLDSFYGALAAERTNTLNLYNLSADLVVAYDALLYAPNGVGESYGYNGEYTEAIMETERDIKRFWDVKSSDIEVMPMHGTMLLDTARVARVYRTVFGIPAGTARTYAAIVRSSIVNSIVWNGGNHPYLTFNAFAFSPGAPFADRIAMGDGMMAGYTAMGYGDVAAKAIFAHEFGHHIQYENGYFDNDALANTADAAANTRYTEIMADAYSAYYLTHARGLAQNKHRVAEFLAAFYEIGDCGFTSSGHHGTPAQRMRAAEFGFAVADAARKQGHIMSSAAFHDLFVAAYPAMVAPDAI